MACPELVPGAAVPVRAVAEYMLYRMTITGPLVVRTSSKRTQPDHLSLIVAHLELPDVATLPAEALRLPGC